MSRSITIYTDGSSRGNPGPGGFGAILICGHHRKEISQGYVRTTNNRMELMAVIAGLKALKINGAMVTIYTDSQYIVKAWQLGWLRKWIRTNFSGGKKNADLWTELHALSQMHELRFEWVKGHASNIFNNRCDMLATEAADGMNHLLIEDTGYTGTLI